MKKIEQTTLSIDDIADHHDFLMGIEDAADKWVLLNDDDMLMRFARTFLGD